MDRTTVTLVTDSGYKDMGADILEKSDMRIKVVLDGSQDAMVLTKSTPHATLYTTDKFGMEFETTGN